MKTNVATLLSVMLGAWSLVCQGESAQNAGSDLGGILVAAAPVVETPSAGDAPEAKPSDPPEALPPIVTDEAPITDVIKFLARQASLNVLIDPKVAGGIGADGKTNVPVILQPLRFENVTPMQALEAILKNYSMEMALDPKTKIARITQKDANAAEPRFTEVYPVQFSGQYNTNMAAITNLALMITQSFPGTRVFADVRSSQLVVNATEKELLLISNLVVRLDVPLQQILIEARFVQTTKRPESMKGIDWTDTLAGQKFSFGNGQTTASSEVSTPGAGAGGTTPGGRPLPGGGGSSMQSTATTLLGSAGGLTAGALRGWNPQTAFLNADGVKAVLSFLNTDADTEYIATPQAVALEGQTTELSDVVNVPVFEEQQGATSGGATQASTVKPNYDLRVGNTLLNEVGIKLVVTPRIAGRTNVFMDLRPEISAKGVDEVKVLGGKRNESPTFTRKRITTQAVVPTGHTLVLGGLVSDLKSKNFSKVPLLGDMPVVGLAFRKESKLRDKKNLMIFVTPTIVQMEDYHVADHGRRFLQENRVVLPADREESAWDRGKPYDWNKGK